MSLRALITNDDGVKSPGLACLADAARSVGLDVTIAAPSWDASGSSASLTSVETAGRLALERCEIDGFTAYGVEAAPAYITWAALTGAFGPPPDVVLSGINRGPNTGRAVLHSGTVGAALTACAHDRLAMAVSIGVGPVTHWDTAGAVARRALPWLTAQRRPIALNVNVPNVPAGEVRGFRRARLAAHGAVRASITEQGAGWVQFEFGPVPDDHEPGTDVALLTERVACFTPLALACEGDDIDTTLLAFDEA